MISHLGIKVVALGFFLVALGEKVIALGNFLVALGIKVVALGIFVPALGNLLPGSPFEPRPWVLPGIG